MATNKKPKKKKQHQAPIVSLKPENLLVKKGRTMPIYECRAHEGWSERGKAQVSVARRMPNGNLVIGFYLVDLWCLGLKDTFFRANVSILEYEDMMGYVSGDVEMLKIEPALAFNMVYAAIEYAEDLGFEPAKDFKHTQYLLPEPDDFEYIEIETGKDERPFYCSGPNDKVQAILQKLDKKLGKGNYGFLMGLDDDDDLDDDEYYFPDPGLRAQITADFFPDRKVDRKVESLDENYKTDFLLQVVVLSLALEMAKGSIETLKEYHDDDFMDDLTEEFMDRLDEMREMDELPPLERTDHEYDRLSNFASFIVSRVLRQGSVDFMFEASYLPILPEYSPEQIKNMSEQEVSEFMMDRFTMMTYEERHYATAKLEAFDVLDKMYPDGTDERIGQAESEQVMKEVWELLKLHDEEGFFDETDMEVLQKFREHILMVIDNFSKG